MKYELIGIKNVGSELVEHSEGVFDTEIEAETMKGMLKMDFEYESVKFKIVQRKE